VNNFRAAFQAIFLWLFLCIVSTILIVSLTGGGHGSVIFIVAGAFSGLCGAFVHTVLLFTTPLRTYPKLKQVIWVSGISMCICIAVGAVLFVTNQSGRSIKNDFEAALILLFFALLPLIPVAFLVCSSFTFTEKIASVQLDRESEKTEHNAP
jgi:hypothetical protein